MRARSPWIISLVVLAAWLVVTLGGEYLQAGEGSLDELVSNGIVWGLVGANVLLVAVVLGLGWAGAAGLRLGIGPRPGLLVPPALAIAVLGGLGIASGLPPTATLASIAFNALLVGISEELMMRGVLFHGASVRFGTSRAIWITVVVFGAIHALNGFLTGNFAGAVVQALLAGGMGTWMAVLRIRLGTLAPLMVLHWLWDTAVFALAHPAGMTNEGAATVGSLLGLGFALVLAAWGVRMIRGLSAAELRAAAPPVAAVASPEPVPAD